MDCVLRKKSIQLNEHDMPHEISVFKLLLIIILKCKHGLVVNALCLHRATKLAFEPSKKMRNQNLQRSVHNLIRHRGKMTMKDKSNSYWFQVDDKVRVISSVKKANVDLRGRVGVVTQTWEKCDVDPTCCCAEFVDDNFAVQVKFEEPLKFNPCKPSENSFKTDVDMFYHYFNEDELVKL